MNTKTDANGFFTLSGATNQDIFDVLSELDAFFYYEKQHQKDPSLEDIHAKVRSCLISFSEYSGCRNF